MTDAAPTASLGLLERLEQGPVICAEGYLFELERRGYLQAGAFVPEAVLEHPELVAQLHREFVHAGSDVVEAFTYYAHREKMRLVGKEHLLEQINRKALEIAKEVAAETGALFAGDICNTNVFVADDESRRAVREMFDEQVGWAAEAGVDFVIGETFSWGEEALIALEAIKETGLPAVITLAIHQEPTTREGRNLSRGLSGRTCPSPRRGSVRAVRARMRPFARSCARWPPRIRSGELLGSTASCANWAARYRSERYPGSYHDRVVRRHRRGAPF